MLPPPYYQSRAHDERLLQERRAARKRGHDRLAWAFVVGWALFVVVVYLCTFGAPS